MRLRKMKSNVFITFLVNILLFKNNHNWLVVNCEEAYDVGK